MDAPTITDPHSVQVTFVNDLLAYGFLNGNINLTFGTARWTPTTIGQESIGVDMIVAGRLRMDLQCAVNLHNALGAIIADQTKPTGKPN